MASRFVIQVVDRTTGRVAASFAPGRAEEADFVRACTEAIVEQGVGLFRTEAQVKEAIRTGLRGVLQGLKEKVRP